MKDKVQFISDTLKPGFKGPNWDEVKNVISNSQFANYKTCPRRWQLTSIKKLSTFEENIHTIYGNAMHEVLQTWITEMYEVSGKSAEEMDLKGMFLKNLKESYVYASQKMDKHFSTKEEMIQFLMYGNNVLEYIQNRRSKYFKIKNFQLLGIEVPIWCTPVDDIENLKFMGYIDLVLYDKNEDEYHVIDIKTSRKGWSKWQKKDKVKTDQLICYKLFFNKQYGIPLDKIKVKYFVLKSEVNEDSMWPESHVQVVSPADGTISCNRVRKDIEDFVNSCFYSDGSHNTEGEYPAVEGQRGYNCTFCDFRNREDLCPKTMRKKTLESE